MHNPWEMMEKLQITTEQPFVQFIEVPSYLERLRFLIGHSSVNRAFNLRYETTIPKKYRIMIHDVTNAFGVSHKCQMTPVGATYYWHNPPMVTRSSVQPLSLYHVLTAASPLTPVMPEDFVDELPVKKRRPRNTYSAAQDEAILRCAYMGLNRLGRYDWADIVWPAWELVREDHRWDINNQQMKDRHRYLVDRNPGWASGFEPNDDVGSIEPTRSRKRAREEHVSDDDDEEDETSWNPDEPEDEESSVSSSISGADVDSIMSEVSCSYVYGV